MKPHLRDRLGDRVVVWMTQVSRATDSLPALERYLDERDSERAGRFHFAGDRNRFVLGRALVRLGIGRYLGTAPEKIELAYTDRGRPFFPHDAEIQFSISHAEDLVGVALTVGARVGIDLESIKPHRDLMDLAERIFSKRDLGIFQALPEAEKLAAFFRAWTGKEAYLKARGEGIAEGLRQISVSLGPDIPLSIDDGRMPAPETWRLVALAVPQTYAGALACDDADRPIEEKYVRFEQGEVVTGATF